MSSCDYCGKEFIKEGQKKKASYCSPSCNSTHWRQKKDKGYTKPLASCLYCEKEFVKTRVDRLFCNYKCGTYYNQRTKLCRLSKTSIKKYKKNTIDLLEIKDFVYDIKRKRFMANHVDIFKLIHYHAQVHPNKFYNDEEVSKETIFNSMYKDLVEHLKIIHML